MDFRPIFREIVSGRRQGLTASGARALLSAIEVPYTWAVRRRNRRYDDPQHVRRAAVPVVSVGNLTLGGTGKTPMVEWLARWFGQRGVRVVLVSRGYGATSNQPNDEARELALALPGLPHIQQPDRVAAAERAVAEFGAELILLDDGFQHRRLARDLDIVLVDALEPLGYGHVFPRGTLREPLAGWARAQVIALSRADLVDAPERARIRREVARFAPQADWLELCSRPRALRNYSGAEQPVTALVGQSVASFCGIGNPAAFGRQLAACDYRITSQRDYADHFAYRPADVAELARWLTALPVSAAVCTRKDLVKICADRLGEKPLWALTIELEISSGADALIARLEALAARALPPRQQPA